MGARRYEDGKREHRVRKRDAVSDFTKVGSKVNYNSWKDIIDMTSKSLATDANRIWFGVSHRALIDAVSRRTVGQYSNRTIQSLAVRSPS